jgi:hypothetical protein
MKRCLHCGKNPRRRRTGYKRRPRVGVSVSIVPRYGHPQPYPFLWPIGMALGQPI